MQPVYNFLTWSVFVQSTKMPTENLDTELYIPKFLTKPRQVYDSKWELQLASNTNFFGHLSTKNERWYVWLKVWFFNTTCFKTTLLWDYTFLWGDDDLYWQNGDSFLLSGLYNIQPTSWRQFPLSCDIFLRNVFDKWPWNRSRLTISHLLIATFLKSFINVACIMMRRGHVSSVSWELFDIDWISDLL